MAADSVALGREQVELSEQLELSIVMPCLDEARTLPACIAKARRSLRELDISGEVVVADNGSTDGSPSIAAMYGARVVSVAAPGYGSAIMGGIAAARGKYIIIGDADDSYDFGAVATFIEKLRDGYDFVMGNRFKGGILPGAMPHLHKYVGNPFLTTLGRLFFGSECGDFHCGMRAITATAAARLDLRTTGMEFASEMIIKATLCGMRVGEVPVVLSPDGRDRRPHLRTWRDGWRHLRFMLLFSPRWLFLYPGIVLAAIGLITFLWLLPAPREVGRVTFDVQTLLYAAGAILVGFQAVAFALFTRMFAVSEGLLPMDPLLTRLRSIISLESGLVCGGMFVLTGLAGSISTLLYWSAQAFGPLDASHTLRFVIPSFTAVVLGFEMMLSSFFFSVLGLARRS